MVSFSLSANSVGGSGCTACLLVILIVLVLTLLLAIGHSSVTCDAVELVTVTPPSGQTCQQYLGRFIEEAGGYITDGDASSNCQYCSYSTTDAFLGQSFNIYYSHHWRDFGIFFAFILFNVSLVFCTLYLSVPLALGKPVWSLQEAC